MGFVRPGIRWAGWRVVRCGLVRGGELGGSPVTGEQVAAVPLLEQIQVGPHAQLPQGAGHPGRAQVQSPLLDVLPGGEDLIGGQLVGDHPGVPGALPERADVRLGLGRFLPLADRLGVQLEDQLVRGRAHLPERHPRRGPGQQPVGRGGVLVGLRMLVSSSMIRSWNGWIRPACSAANDRGSRVATVAA